MQYSEVPLQVGNVISNGKKHRKGKVIANAMQNPVTTRMEVLASG